MESKVFSQELVLEWGWGPGYPLFKAPAYITTLEPGMPEDTSQHLNPGLLRPFQESQDPDCNTFRQV